MSRIAFIGLFIFLGISVCLAQDTTHKKSVVKAQPKYKTHKYYGESARRYKADSAAKAAAQVPVAKPDTTAATPAPAPADKSLNGQYQYLLSKVYHYQQPLISALWKNASDTLNANRSKLKGALDKVKIQSKTIDSLNTELANDATASARANGIDIFGIVLTKTTYNFIVWGLVALFGIIAFVVIVRSGSHRREAKYRTQLYSELEEEFKTFKAKANDKEKKLARELQTERNKLDDLLGK